MKQYLEAGVIVGTHGVRGELRVQPWTDSPEFLTGFKTLYFAEGAKKLSVTSSRVHKNLVLVKLKGVDSIESGDELRGKVLYLDRADARLPAGSYFVQDIIGLECVDSESGEVYGRITDVTSTRSNDVYTVAHKDGKEYLMPVIDDVVKSIEPENGRVLITVIGGLFGDAH